MPFDFGWEFHGASGMGGIEPPYGAAVQGESYPHTYTNANGLSINAGWTTAINSTDRSGSLTDLRLAGINYGAPSTEWKVDLASGSAPGAGGYQTDMAIGDTQIGHSPVNPVVLKDTSTTLLSFNGSTSAVKTFVDATGVTRSPDDSATAWDIASKASVTFATTTALLQFTTGENACIAHFRLTLVAGGLGWKTAGERPSLAGPGGLAA
jgi:hypothetical protein